MSPFPHKLAVCAIFRDEGPYLREWIEFHRLMGVEHFFLYDNDSRDGGAAELAPYIEQGLVTLCAVARQQKQRHAYVHCIASFREAARWIAFIDLDEFLFSPTGASLPAVLEHFEAASAVAVNWCTFGPSGHEQRPDDLVTASYDRGLPTQHLINRHVKSVVNPRETRGFLNVHVFTQAGQTVDELGRSAQGALSDEVSFDLLRINHYWTKSVEECRAKFARGRADTGESRPWQEFLALRAALDAVEDRTVMAHVPTLRARLAAVEADQLVA